jgi:hypothetical protein
MNTLVNLLLDSWKQQRATLQSLLGDMTSGKFRIGGNHGSGWVDTTQKNIDRVTTNIAELDQLIAEYDPDRQPAQRRFVVPVEKQTAPLPDDRPIDPVTGQPSFNTM